MTNLKTIYAPDVYLTLISQLTDYFYPLITTLGTCWSLLSILASAVQRLGAVLKSWMIFKLWTLVERLISIVFE